MNSDKICHFGVHFFAFQKLKRQVGFFTAPSRFGLDLHIVKVNFSFPDTWSKYHVMLGIFLKHIYLFLLDKEGRLIP